MVSYQCSPLSTPEGIVGTFRQCAKLQENQDLNKFVSVVVLDEVGLAEDSPRMPLKVFIDAMQLHFSGVIPGWTVTIKARSFTDNQSMLFASQMLFLSPDQQCQAVHPSLYASLEYCSIRKSS